jgi:hypothetical protein
MPTPNAVKLNTPLPRNWERAFGYRGEREWLAAYWEPAGDEAEYDDGYSAGTANWPVYLELKKRLGDQVDLALAGTPEGRFELGSSESLATHCLLMNLVTREIYITPLDEARRMMREKSESPEIPEAPAGVSHEEFMEILHTAFDKALEEVNEAMKDSVFCQDCRGAGWLPADDGGYDMCETCQGEGWYKPSPGK